MVNRLELEAKQKLLNREISEADFKKYESYIGEIFSAFGMDLKSESTKESPRRFLDALFEITSGYDGDPKLIKAFESECSGINSSCSTNQIVQGPIHFYSLCEHHGLPFFGSAYVGYIANEDIIGISKLTRLVRLFSNRFTVQERIGQEVADLLIEMVNPLGVG
ncbi:MAG: GTP cyclohydrolase I, partial [Sphaerochaetaceae bacterium]